MHLTSHLQSACTNGVTWHGPKGWAGRSHLRPRDGVGRSGQKTPATPFWDWCCPHRSRFPEGQDCCRLSSRNQLELLGTNVNTKCFKMLSVPPPQPASLLPGRRRPLRRAPRNVLPTALRCSGTHVMMPSRAAGNCLECLRVSRRRFPVGAPSRAWLPASWQPALSARLPVHPDCWPCRGTKRGLASSE